MTVINVEDPNERQIEQQIVSFDAPELPNFPVTIFPEWLRNYIQGIAEETQTPLDASCMTALSVLSASLAKKFVLTQPWREQNNLYTLVIMQSGERKSVIYSRFVKPLIAFERNANQRRFDTQVEASTEIAERPIPPARYLADDVTPEKLVGLLKENNERLAILSAEGGLFETVNGRYGNIPNLDVYLKAFTGDYLTVDRVNRPSERLFSPTLTIGLFVQPTVIQELPARLVYRGLLGRFLFTVPVSMRGRRKANPEKINHEVVVCYEKMVNQMMQFEPAQTIQLSLEEEARELFDTYLAMHEERLGADGDLSNDLLRSWTERLPGHLLRIASLIHVSEQIGQHGELSVDSLRSAITVETMDKVLSNAEYFVEHAMAAYGCTRNDEELQGAKYVLDVMLRQPRMEFKRQDIWQSTKSKFPKSEQLDRAIRILEDRGYVMLDYKSSGSGRGRKGLVVQLNSKIKDIN